MFLSVAVFGMGFYMLLRLVGLTAEAMHRRNWINVYGPVASSVLTRVAWLVFSMEIACTVLGAHWAFHTFVT